MYSSIVSPVQPYRPLYEDAYDALREAILTGRLAPGDRLVEAELARQMAISRAPIREAVRKLEQDGLVAYRPRRGTVVVRLSREEVLDTYYLRAHLEGYVARLAATRMTSKDLDELDTLIEQMRQCAVDRDLRGLIAADIGFHSRICCASGSKRAHKLWLSLNPTSWTLLTGLKAAVSLTDIAERHRPILQSLRARDAEGVEAAIRCHIVELADNVVAHLDPPETTGATETSAGGGGLPNSSLSFSRS